jgi:hypothetical protein
MSPVPPLTHHEILRLVEPFARRGLILDLPASDRGQRRLVFAPRDHAPEGALPALRESLCLGVSEAGWCELVRATETADGLQATVKAEGPDPGALLERIAAVPAAAQFRAAAGSLTALSYRVSMARGTGAEPQALLTEAESWFGRLALRMRLSGVRGYPADLELHRRDGEPGAVMQLPDDLLSVLGRHWERLTAVRQHWIASVQIDGDGLQRSRDAEQRLQRTVDHLVATLSEPPARFHERHRGARWTVALRRAVPLLIGLSVIGAALWVQAYLPEQRSVLALLANVAPPLLMGLIFLRREMPRVELPRIPRRLPSSAWANAPGDTGRVPAHGASQRPAERGEAQPPASRA